ncbi:hypothetical protein VIGAN_02138400 [Vigna angularis var. angularis]|uniref:Uncharacterized protein n=1 Tax=Vigna angularis var. angularis TaxID=157739 RepID=A0A0S3RDV5_PHAAN|nr:hypothetical protein VIGAN_02138400 [Vigna angularis var. angularis]
MNNNVHIAEDREQSMKQGRRQSKFRRRIAARTRRRTSTLLKKSRTNSMIFSKGAQRSAWGWKKESKTLRREGSGKERRPEL